VIPHDKLEALLTRTARSQHVHGEKTWQRTWDWTRVTTPPRPGIHGGGISDGSRSDDAIDRAQEDAQAARYYAELKALTVRLVADLHRLMVLHAICDPDGIRKPASRELQAAQVAADGWCISCWRDNQHLEPTMKGQYRDRCRFCGDWRRQHQADPPLAILAARHTGRRITQADVDRALGKVTA
jgi:hypothetical protein